MPQQPTPQKLWEKLETETGMNDVRLRQRLEHFLDWQYERMMLVHYIKTLGALDLSRGFHRRFHKRNKDVGASIHYWTMLSISSIHMHMEGIRNLSDSTGAYRSRLLPQLDLLKTFYQLYLADEEESIWNPMSRKSRFIRCKWNAPDLEDSYFCKLCTRATDRKYANILLIIFNEAIHAMAELRTIMEFGKCLLEFETGRQHS